MNAPYHEKPSKICKKSSLKTDYDYFQRPTTANRGPVRPKTRLKSVLDGIRSSILQGFILYFTRKKFNPHFNFLILAIIFYIFQLKIIKNIVFYFKNFEFEWVYLPFLVFRPAVSNFPL
jgi:hypothetical protein